MKTCYICTECGSQKVQSKAWVSLNDHTDIDFSLSSNNDYDDNWCQQCGDHTSVEQRTFYELGDEVYWKDPADKTSGVYTIIEKLDEDGENSTYLISNKFSEAEVYEHELTLKICKQKD